MHKAIIASINRAYVFFKVLENFMGGDVRHLEFGVEFSLRRRRGRGGVSVVADHDRVVARTPGTLRNR